jgi:arginyl-tRNA synthetase
VITRDLRCAIARAVAAGCRQAREPGLRPTGTPGQYAASIALTLGGNPREMARELGARLAEERWIDTAEVTGPGYLTITVTPEALAAVADNVAAAGPACIAGGALAGVTVPAPPPGDPLTASTWEEARAALAARLTARLATAAGATLEKTGDPERARLAEPRSRETEVTEAVAFAGRDAVTFTLARAIPGKPLRVDPEIIARRIPGNPAYAVRYAHARAASGVRWAAASSAAGAIGVAEASALLDALSWLPERIATAARRGRPDEFARYLEDLASVTVDVLSSLSRPQKETFPGNDIKSGASLADHGGVNSCDRSPSTSDRGPRSGEMREAQGAGSNPSGADEVRPSSGEAEDGALSRESPSFTARRVQRLTLAKAARTGLAAGLALLGVTAPDRL